jgi:hypothetical protein
VIGLKWLAAVFYPNRLGHDLRETTRGFHRLFYRVDPPRRRARHTDRLVERPSPINAQALRRLALSG